MYHIEEQADFIDEAKDYVQNKYMGWYIERALDTPKEHLKIISDFIVWIIEEMDKDIYVKRGPKNLSYDDWRSRRGTI